MVSIFVGSGAGFARGSGATLGAAGILGSGVQGRSGETVSVNAATGNLLIAQQDEFLVGRGPDAAVSRTYNSLAQASDDNGDQWRFGAQRRLQNWTGTANSAGATVDRVGEDGSVVTYSYDVGLGYYRATDGAGAHDRIVNVGHWIWTDGDTQTTEGYDVGGVLLGITDTDGNSVSFTYHAHTSGWRLSRATTANGEYQEYQWSGENVSQIVTGYTDLATGIAKTLTRTRYAYDGQNRLVQVTVDLSPNDNSVADGKTYVTTYTYDGSSKRVASITQTDGSSLAIAYDAAGRVTTLTQTVGVGDVRVTALAYGPSFTDMTAPDGQVTRLEYTGGNLVPMSVLDWPGNSYVIRASADPIMGETATRLTSTGAGWSGIRTHEGNPLAVSAGETITFTLNLQAAAGSATSQDLGIYGNATQWGGGAGGFARIISGPGQIVQSGDGFARVTGLSTTEATRIEIVRTFAQDDLMTTVIYVDGPGGCRDGQQLLVSGATLTKVANGAMPLKQLSRIIMPPASAGAPRQVTEFIYSPNGDLIETRTGTVSENLLDLDGWAGERRGPNLLDLSGWPINPNSLPSGPATLAGWANPSWTIGEARWAQATGPQGGTVAVIQTGQTDSLDPGGGNYSHGFAVDKNKAYEFSTYFQVTDLNKHRLYFGLDGQNAVVNALDGTPDGNPYFAYPYPGLDGVPYRAGRWYRIVGYVLPAGAGNLQAVTDLGGIYDVETGERIADVMNYRWADTQPSGSPQGGVRFCNYYSQSVQGYYTNYYRPEVHEINLPGGAGTVQNWYNWHAEETRWASTIGPDGKQAFVIEAGQINATIGGGGNHSSYVDVDRGKAYEFTYYFQFNDTGKHSIYFGLHGPLGVEQLHDGAANSNPYFFAIGPDQQPANFAEGRWYKVVGYVLPSGSTAVPADQMGGVYDTVTGEKILNLWSNFRWSGSGSDTRIGVRFFNFYYENNLQYSTYFGKPEMREAPHRVATSGGYAGYTAAAITDRKFFKYDTRGNLIETRDNEGNIVTRTYGAKNELLIETWIGSDASGAAVAHNTRYVYDSENHLRYVISPEGRVTEYIYTATGEIASRIEYTEHGYPIGSMPPTEAEVVSWRGGIADKQSDKIVTYLYDARGNQIQEVDYGYAAAAGYGVTSEGYAHHYFAYDQTGRLLSRVTATLATETFLYDGLGRMVGSTDLAGGTTTIVFNDAALTTTVTTASGYTTVSSYNKAGDLVAVADASSWSPSGTSAYAYDKLGRVRIETDPFGYKTYYLYDAAGRKTAGVSNYGHIIEYRYDTAGRIAATIRYYHEVSTAHLSQLANPDTSLTIADIRPSDEAAIWAWSLYDDAGRLIEEINGDGRVVRYDYDASGRLVRTYRFANVLSAAQVTSFKAAAPAGIVVPAAHPYDVVTRSFYDRDGRLIGSLDGEGYLAEIVYDKAGQKVEEIAYATKTSSGYWSAGSFNELRATAVPTASTNRRNRYVYDGQGLLRFGIDTAGRVTEYVYKSEVEWGAIGLVRSTILHAVPISTSDFTYDNVKALVAANASNAANRTSWSVYDAAGRMTYAIDADGAVVAFTYDVMGNVTKSVAFAAKRPTTSLPSEATMNGWRDANIANGANRITRNWYASRGELRFTVDSEGFVTEHNYDAEGKMVDTIRYDTAVSFGDGTAIGTVASTVSADYSAGRYQLTWVQYDNYDRVEFTYDALGTQTRYWRSSNSIFTSVVTAVGTADASSPSYRYHNQAGQVAWEGVAWGESEAIERTFYYDGLGNLTGERDPRWKTTSYTYDKRGLLLTKTDAAGGVTSYEYNAFGEVVKTVDPRGHATYTYYDELGHVVKIRDAEDYITETSYTAFGEVASVTRRYNKTASAVSTTTPPTVTAHTQDATTSFEYDKRGLVTKTTDAEGWFETYGYDAFGNRTSVTAKSKDGNKVAGGVTSYAYDRRGLLIRETLPVSSYDNNGNALLSSVTGGYDVSTTYAYDARGNRIQMIEAAGLPEARTTTYVYDRADRLTQTRSDVIRVVPATGQNIVETRVDQISYDARGNVTSTTDGAGARTVYYYDDLDRVVVTINAGGIYTSNVYDANGNVTAARVYDAGMAIPADGGSEEEKPAAPGGIYRETTFTYDNLNRLLTSSVAGVTSYIFNGSGYVVQATNLTTTYEYDAAGNVIKTVNPNGNASFYYYNALGQKRAALDAGGYVTYWAYDAEGNVIAERLYAARFTGTPSTSTIPSVAIDGADRFTQFGYDRNGNRTHEQREAVLVHNGSGGTTTTTAIIFYQYNGLGQVVRKTEATGEDIQYLYDSAGRVGREIRSAFTSHQGSSVSPTIDYFYNGLGDLTRTVAGGTGDAASRVTRYQYGTGGVLEWVQDASGQTVYRYQDIVGRNPGTLTIHQRSDGTLLSSREYSLQDHLGRVTETLSYYYDNSTGWDWGTPYRNVYNAYGDVVTTTVNGATSSESLYDAAGRLIATTAGDGVWKHYGYDANGNQTIAITSAGASLAGLSFAQALALVGQENVTATYTQYDARGQAVGVTEEQRRLSGSTVQDLTSTRTYNAFGEVVSETNAAGATTTYSYNNIGRMIRSEGPTVQITLENGATQWVKPSQDHYYDASGRLVASRDANGSYAGGGTSGNGTSKDANSGNLTRLTLLAGTGYNGSAALVTHETHADGGVKQTRYDVHGDARVLIDEIGRTTTQIFDAMGRVTQVNHAGGLTDTYAYDGLGQRIKHWNSFLGAGDVETTDYDTQGRVIKTRAFGGDVTTTSYSWSSTLVGNGTGTAAGGWTQVTTMANGRTATEQTDLFGRTIWNSDLGGNITYYVFDIAGRQISSSMGGATSTFAWFNTGQLASNANATGTESYGYDAAGNRTSEYMMGSSSLLKNATATYDALGRLLTWSHAGGTWAPASSTTHSYDAAGNIRSTTATYTSLSGTGTSLGSLTQTYWFRFDAMNRLVVDKGALSGAAGAVGTTITRGSGRDIAYDQAGQRSEVRTTMVRPERVHENPVTGDLIVTPARYWEVREGYGYDAAGRLTEVRISSGGESETSVPPAPTPTLLRSSLAYDAMGRQTGQTDYDTNGTTVIFSRTTSWNAKGQMLIDDATTLRYRPNSPGATDLLRGRSVYDYGTGSGYALGNALTIATQNWKNGIDTGSNGAPDTLTSNAYAWYDGAVQSSISFDGDTGSSSNPLGSTVYSYDGRGLLTSVAVSDGRARTVTFTNDVNGQAVRRDEADGNGAQGDPHEIWYRFAGRQMGYTGNNGTSDMDWQSSVTERMARPPAFTGPFRDGSSTSRPYADFTASYDAYNSYAQASASGRYTARAGDSLASVAASLWGDANLWYKLAETNGMSGNAALMEGQQLTLPAGVSRNTHNASTFKPYDPADIIGDTMPTTPKPPKGAKCGMLGTILVAAIAIAVAALAGPQFIAAAQGMLAGAGGGALAGSAAAIGGGILGGAAAGALGSIVSQGFGVATGIQSGFSWKGVGLAAIAGGIGGGITGLSQGVNAAGNVVGQTSRMGGIGGFLSRGGVTSAIARGVTTNALTQGVGMATGLQSKFDFAGVAAAGAVHGASAFAGGGQPGASTGTVIAANAAGAIAGAATRSALTGTSFGDNLMRVLPDTIANSLILAAGAILSRHGGNDGGRGSGHVQRLNGQRVAYLDQPEDGGTFGVTGYGHYDDGDTIVVTAQRRAGEVIAVMGSALEALGFKNDYWIYRWPLDRMGMQLTNNLQALPHQQVRPIFRTSHAPRPGIMSRMTSFVTSIPGRLQDSLGEVLVPPRSRITVDDLAMRDKSPMRFSIAGQQMDREWHGKIETVFGLAIMGAQAGRSNATMFSRAHSTIGAAETAVPNITANKVAGDAIRDVIAAREAPALTEQTFTTVGGVRRVDVLKLGDDTLAIESKVGRTSLGSRERQELARDWWLQRQGQVGGVRWEFSPSGANGGVGPSPALQRMLDKLGFETRINK